MARRYGRFPPKKTPFGKVVKPKKPKPAFVSPMKMRFVVWQFEQGKEIPDDETQLKQILRFVKSQKDAPLEVRLERDPSGMSLHSGWFSQLPKLPRSVVYRLEAWNTGERNVARIAKSGKLEDGSLYYQAVKQEKIWRIR